MGCVYKLTNKQNGLSYVGQVAKPGKTLDIRLREHRRDAQGGIQHLLSCAIREFGWDAFEYVELVSDIDDVEEIDRLERRYIKEFDTNVSGGGVGYNMTAGGQGTFGFKWSEKSRDKKRVHCPMTRYELEKLGHEMRVTDIALKYGVYVGTVIRWFQQFGIVRHRIKQTVNNQNKGAWSVLDEAKLLHLYDQGKSFAEIACALERSATAVIVKFNRLRKRLGLVGTARRRKNQHMKTFVWE